MSAYLIAGPAVEPVSLPEAKAHLRLDGADEDELVGALLRAARLAVEGACRLLLVQQSWRVTLPAWPPGRTVELALAPVMAVSAIRIFDAADAPSTVLPALYRLESAGDPARLVADPAAPDPGAPPGRIEIDLLCGFGAAAESVPAPIRLALRMLVARWFERRGDDPSGSPIPADVAALLAPYRRPRLA